MFAELLKHTWRESVRSSYFNRKVISNIVLAILLGYFFLNLVFLGYFLDAILIQTMPEFEPVEAFNSILLFYFLIDLVLRFMLQTIPVMSIEPYLHIPIPKRTLVNYLLIKSLKSFFNLFPFLLILPFFFKVLLVDYYTLPSLVWLLGILALLIGNSYTAFFLKKQVMSKPIIIVIAGVVLSALFLLDKFEYFLFSDISVVIFDTLIENNIYIITFILYPILMYLLNFNFLMSNTYIQDISHKEKTNTSSGNLELLKKFGRIGELIGLELKLILRNKRPKSTMITSLIILIYGVIFYPQERYIESLGMLIFVGATMTGMPIVGYGNLLFSWNSSFFDSVLVNNISLKDYIRSKYIILSAAAIGVFLLTIPYVYYGLNILLINFVCLLFNLGTATYFMIFAGMLKPKKIDLSKKATFNYEGVGGIQFVTMLPVMIAPQIIMIPFYIMDNENLGLMILGIIGILGITLQKQIVSGLSNRFWKKRHVIADNFREQ